MDFDNIMRIILALCYLSLCFSYGKISKRNKELETQNKELITENIKLSNHIKQNADAE